MSVVTLVSGGVDSALMSVMVKEQGITQWPLFIDYGQLSRQREWSACNSLFRRYGLPSPVKMNLSGFGKVIASGLTNKEKNIKDEAFLPGRNLLFLLAGSSYAYQQGSDAVAIGLLNEDVSLFPDQTSLFLESAQRAIEMALDKEIKILAPLMLFNKVDILELARQRHILDTYSCHSGRERPCGICIACHEISGALRAKGV